MARRRLPISEETTSEEVDVNQKMYVEYVEGVPINQIAEEFGVEPQDVVVAIEAIEATRRKA